MTESKVGTTPDTTSKTAFKTESRTILVDYIARVEGEGALRVRHRGPNIEDVQLKIFEAPRFFEAFLRDRHLTEAPDMTARICGICPIAYQMSSVHAMENALGLSVTGPLRSLRRLIYCGEWIESHVLHIYLLHAPDFLGHSDAIRIARDQPNVIQRGLQLKKTGNALMTFLGGREIHPINVRVGGFYSVPSRRSLLELKPRFEWAREAAYETLRWAAGFDFPDFENDYEFVSLSHPDEYPFNEGRIHSSRGLSIAVKDYDDHFEESQADYTNALHSVRKDTRSAYLTGPMARFNLNFERFSPLVRRAADEIGLRPPCRNPFKSILVRCLEVLYACDEVLRLIDAYVEPKRPYLPYEHELRPAIGFAATEAPRGLLYHRYKIAGDGRILDAKIVPPTSQNQLSIESDLRTALPDLLALSEPELARKCETFVRNHDPCISCATHFLKLDLEEL